jgi:streptomycin 6-kinase
LLRADLDRGAMLLERCEPGAPLTSVEDDAEATAIASEVMRRLWWPVPASHPFPTVSDWSRGLDRLQRRFGGGTGPMPAALVKEAERLFARLIPSQAEPVLLHGDFHHDNILAARRGQWLVIDPKGLVGELAYDAATLLREPPGLARHPNLRAILERRLDQLSEELKLERERLRGWALAQAVLAAYWGLEDSGRVWEEALIFAEALFGIRA